MLGSSRDQLLYAFRRVLRPLIRILIRSGVRYDEFLELVRGVYVESAVRDGLGDGIRVTRAKVSVSTGIGRRDVDKYIDNDGALPAAPRTLALSLTEILNRWHTDPQFVGPYGIPLELEITSQKARSFKELVSLIAPSANMHDVLEELIRMGTVVRSGSTHVRTVSRVFIPSGEMTPSQLEFFGSTLTRLADTLQYNMDNSNTEKRIERSVVSDRGLPASFFLTFREHVRERVNDLLFEIDNWMSPHTRNLKEVETTQRVGLSIYQFVDPVVDTTPLKEHITEEVK